MRRNGGRARTRPTALDYALAAGATARLARLVTQDVIFDEARLRFVRRMDETGHSKLAELAVCSWCSSMWIGVAVAIAVECDLPGTRLATGALTSSLVAGLAAELGAGEHVD